MYKVSLEEISEDNTCVQCSTQNCIAVDVDIEEDWFSENIQEDWYFSRRDKAFFVSSRDDALLFKLSWSGVGV